MKMLFRFVFVILILFSGSSYAICIQYGTPSNETINLGSIIVQRDAPVGSVFWTKSISLSNVIIGQCNGSSTLYYTFLYNSGQPSGYTHYYNTPVSGVAMSVTINNTYGSLLGYYDNPRYVDSFSGDYYIHTGPSTTVSLIKTGPITSGIMPSGKVGSIVSDSGLTYMGLYMNSASITQVACSISTPTLNFPIGNIMASTFGSTVGTTPPAASNTQNLGLSCDANARVNVTLTGTKNPDVSTASVLALTGQGNADVAKGVGVQILYNGTPINLNGSPLYWKTSSGGQETFPLTARYYQTKTTVATGKANASATLNITYQ